MAIHTNAWWQVKYWLPSAGRYCLKHHFPVFVWLSYNKNKGHDLFLQFLDLMAQLNEKVSSNHKDIEDSDSVKMKMNNFFCLTFDYYRICDFISYN